MGCETSAAEILGRGKGLQVDMASLSSVLSRRLAREKKRARGSPQSADAPLAGTSRAVVVPCRDVLDAGSVLGHFS